MTLAVINDFVRSYDKLRLEIEHAPEPVRAEIQIPGEGAIEAAVKYGDIFLGDPIDNGRTDRGGTIIQLHAEPSWSRIEAIWIPHIWGESTKHYQILLDLCDWGETRYPQPVKYGVLDHPLNNIATRWFVTPDQIVDQVATTTFAQAGALGRGNRAAAARSIR